MGKKLVITTEQYSRLVETIKGDAAQQILSEGTFQNIKNILSSLSKKKNISKDPKTLANVSNQLVKDLDADIRQKDPDFPNSKDNTIFLNTVLQLNAAYEEVHGATYLPPTEDGYLTVPAANAIISDLRTYVQDIRDRNLKGIYKNVYETDYPAVVNKRLGDTAATPVPKEVGKKESRAAILTNLLNSIKPVDPAELPKHVALPTAPAAGAANVRRGTFDPAFEDIYRSTLSLFKFIINNRKMLGVRAGARVGTGAAIDKMMKPGDKRLYKGNEVEVLKIDSAPGRTQVKYPGKKNIFAVKTSDLQKITPAGALTEGRYITDPNSVAYLEKATSTDKVKLFEQLIGMVDSIRPKVRNLKPTGTDAKLDNIIARFRANPIMLTDFQKMFNVPADDMNGLRQYKTFMDEILLGLYSGNLDRLAKFGGGLNKMNEAPEYNTIEPNKAFLADAQDRRAFKKNLTKFLSVLFELFMHLWAQKNPKKVKP
jgi:hypothetical protein